MKLYGISEDDNNFYMILELMNGGEVFNNKKIYIFEAFRKNM